MANNRKTIKNETVSKEAADKAAAMFSMTAMSQKELSEEAKLVEDQSGNPIENMIKNREIEKQHQEELKEAKELGMENEPIQEATTSEIVKGLQKDLEESQNRYVALSEEKEKIEKSTADLKKKISELLKSNSDLSKENEELSKRVNELDSELDVSKTDYSREILDYKIQIEDFQKKISAYEQNESNYKFEITKLKAEINNLETALAEKPEAKKAFDKKIHSTPATTIVPMFTPRTQQKHPGLPNAGRENGYDSWN